MTELMKNIRTAKSEKQIHNLVRDVDLSRQLRHWNIRWNPNKREYDSVVRFIDCVGVHRMPLDGIKADFVTWI